MPVNFHNTFLFASLDFFIEKLSAAAKLFSISRFCVKFTLNFH